MHIPKHIAIIPDGNRRWARHNGMEKQDGYHYGLTPGVTVLRLAQAYGIDEITYYGFTTDNVKRPSAQVNAFSKACVDAIGLIMQEDVQLLVVGNTNSPAFPKALLPYTQKRISFGNGTIKVNFLVNYGWEWDMSHMHTASANRNTIADNLHSREISRIDLIMRWGGHTRLSGLLPVQSVYADFYSIDTLWPDFKSEEFVEGLAWYGKQDVTLGG
ncbi:MAG: di-trans,poly-cis-decaprenylcistransferase [Lachnospiraceae bacterium]|nr:di-trans,poly-cis-decaprenylcistransferase [Lachnospiraceae bacterium]